MRDSQYKSCAVQNQFTAYLIAAIRNYKRTYLRRISTALRTELPMEGHSEVMELCEETDFFCGLPLMQRLENERLFAAMQVPMIFGPRELSKILGISKNKTYEVVNRYDFPKIRVGRRIIISKKHFLEWMDANFGKERNNT